MTCSIAMCTYNGEKYIKEQLESIINQSTQPDEIIICDDGSTDRTIDIVKAVLKSWNGRWRVFENEHNLGYKKNFQKAISLCGSDIIFLSDQDDVWNANKIEIMMKVFQDNPYILLAFHDSEIVDDHLNCIKKSWSFTLKKAIIAHKNNIKRRKFVWYTLLLNYKNKRGVENCSLNNHYAFLVARLQCIDNKKYFALPFREYWSTYKNSYYSVKEYIKDLLACSF